MSNNELDEVVALMMAEFDREEAEKIAAMRAEGREPANRDGQAATFCPIFDFTLRWPKKRPGDVEIRISAYVDGHDEFRRLWGQPWPERPETVSAETLLALLAERWTDIGQGYLADSAPSHPVEVDFSAPFGAVVPPFKLTINGREITSYGLDGRLDHGVESLVVVETLAALGDRLASGLEGSDTHSKSAVLWRRVRPLVNVLTTPVHEFERGFDDGDGPSMKEETAFWAENVGQSPQDFRRAALWLQARQWLHAVGNGDEPKPAEWDSRVLPKGLPDESSVAALVDEAIAQCTHAGMKGADQLELEALTIRFIDVRHRVFYAKDEPASPAP